jgi:hypothetical protein
MFAGCCQNSDCKECKESKCDKDTLTCSRALQFVMLCSHQLRQWFADTSRLFRICHKQSSLCIRHIHVHSSRWLQSAVNAPGVCRAAAISKWQLANLTLATAACTRPDCGADCKDTDCETAECVEGEAGNRCVKTRAHLSPLASIADCALPCMTCTYDGIHSIGHVLPLGRSQPDAVCTDATNFLRCAAMPVRPWTCEYNCGNGGTPCDDSHHCRGNKECVDNCCVGSLMLQLLACHVHVRARVMSMWNWLSAPPEAALRSKHMCTKQAITQRRTSSACSRACGARMPARAAESLQHRAGVQPTFPRARSARALTARRQRARRSAVLTSASGHPSQTGPGPASTTVATAALPATAATRAAPTRTALTTAASVRSRSSCWPAMCMRARVMPIWHWLSAPPEAALRSKHMCTKQAITQRRTSSARSRACGACLPARAAESLQQRAGVQPTFPRARSARGPTARRRLARRSAVLTAASGHPSQTGPGPASTTVATAALPATAATRVAPTRTALTTAASVRSRSSCWPAVCMCVHASCPFGIGFLHPLRQLCVACTCAQSKRLGKGGLPALCENKAAFQRSFSYVPRLPAC